MGAEARKGEGRIEPSFDHPEAWLRESIGWVGELRGHLEKMLPLETTLVVGGAFGLKLVGAPLQLTLALSAFCIALLGTTSAVLISVGLIRVVGQVSYGIQSQDALDKEWSRIRPLWNSALACHVFGLLAGVALLALYGFDVALNVVVG